MILLSRARGWFVLLRRLPSAQGGMPVQVARWWSRSIGARIAVHRLRHAADSMGEASGQSTADVLLTKPPTPSSGGFSLLWDFAGRKESRRADSNRFPHLITSDNSCIAGVCAGLQFAHI